MRAGGAAAQSKSPRKVARDCVRRCHFGRRLKIRCDKSLAAGNGPSSWPICTISLAMPNDLFLQGNIGRKGGSIQRTRALQVVYVHDIGLLQIEEGASA